MRLNRSATVSGILFEGDQVDRSDPCAGVWLQARDELPGSAARANCSCRGSDSSGGWVSGRTPRAFVDRNTEPYTKESRVTKGFRRSLPNFG
jgi:hypothetical protein